MHIVALVHPKSSEISLVEEKFAHVNQNRPGSCLHLQLNYEWINIFRFPKPRKSKTHVPEIKHTHISVVIHTNKPWQVFQRSASQWDKNQNWKGDIWTCRQTDRQGEEGVVGQFGSQGLPPAALLIASLTSCCSCSPQALTGGFLWGLVPCVVLNHGATQVNIVII